MRLHTFNCSSCPACKMAAVQPLKIRILLVALTITYIFTFPLIFLICAPVYLFRFVLGFIVKFAGGMTLIPSRSAIFAWDSTEDFPCAAIVVHITIDGKPDMEVFRRQVLVTMVDKKKGFKLVYPELRQFVVTVMGFTFWKNEDKFNIDDHVRFCEQPEMDFGTSDLLRIHEILIRYPFKKNRSPWELIAFESQNECETHVFFRMHHCLSDGFSVLRLLMTEMTGQDLSPPISSMQKGTKGAKLSSLWDLFRIPYEQAAQRHFANDVNLWHNKSLQLTRRYHAVMSNVIKVDFIRKIKRAGKDYTFTSIILEGLAGGIRQFLHARKMSSLVHHPMHIICPLPVTSRPEGVGNCWTFAFVPLPVNKSQREERLAEIMTSLRSLADSSVARVNYALVSCVGALPVPLMKRFGRNVFSTGIASIFPGPQHVCYFNGRRVKDMTFAGGLLHGDQGICVTLISYAGQFRIFLLVDHQIIRLRKDAEDLMKNICDDIHELSLL